MKKTKTQAWFMITEHGNMLIADSLSDPTLVAYFTDKLVFIRWVDNPPDEWEWAKNTWATTPKPILIGDIFPDLEEEDDSPYDELNEDGDDN